MTAAPTVFVVLLACGAQTPPRVDTPVAAAPDLITPIGAPPGADGASEADGPPAAGATDRDAVARPAALRADGGPTVLGQAGLWTAAGGAAALVAGGALAVLASLRAQRVAVDANGFFDHMPDARAARTLGWAANWCWIGGGALLVAGAGMTWLGWPELLGGVTFAGVPPLVTTAGAPPAWRVAARLEW